VGWSLVGRRVGPWSLARWVALVGCCVCRVCPWRFLKVVGSLRVGRRVGPWRGGLLGSVVALVFGVSFPCVGCLGRSSRWSLARVGPWRFVAVLGVSSHWSLAFHQVGK